MFDLCSSIPKLKDSYNVCGSPITGTVYSNTLENILFADVDGKVHLFKQSF